jgi:hypothetical protein
MKAAPGGECVSKKKGPAPNAHLELKVYASTSSQPCCGETALTRGSHQSATVSEGAGRGFRRKTPPLVFNKLGQVPAME